MMQWKWVEAHTAERGLSLLRRLADHGYEGYFVGGCVRDELIGRPINDMDIATNATPAQVLELFEHTVPTGIAHGTVTVIVEGEHFELTTYRTEGQYVDHRRPEQVEFVSDLYEDLRRRDFTMNAIARGLDGNYVDPFHGRDDLQKGMIRAVGVPGERFDEDALRMLRGLRFASVFDFELESDTWAALLERRELIRYIATERIRVEMEKMIAGSHPVKGIRLLQASGLLRYMKVHIPCPAARSELLERLEKVPGEPWVLRWTLLVLALGLNDEAARQALKQWTFSNAAVDHVVKLLRLHEHLLTVDAPGSAAYGKMKRLRLLLIAGVLQYGRDTAALWQQLYSALPDHDHTDRLRLLYEQAPTWIDSMHAYSLADLCVNGQDVLSALNTCGGPWLGKLMQQLLLAVASGELVNERHAVLDYARTCAETGGKTDA
ncbi:CCA tRNA nucleotidyltransferase [Paenibacillus campi]|uniref:CCA tRNA nucleotidyltransferase n=1 Tax=Paenibacillus campi TaxID=3106031 RepID=UPI002AFE8268|nr:CCA tRNA nucleotidyltransferase [Paenibacillus sp. SGZ-1009]